MGIRKHFKNLCLNQLTNKLFYLAQFKGIPGFLSGNISMLYISTFCSANLKVVNNNQVQLTIFKKVFMQYTLD